jgi:hypothetical protein
MDASADAIAEYRRSIAADHLGRGYTYVLCEINVSSVYPFPEHAPAEIARLAVDRVLTAKAARGNDGGAGGKPFHLR